MAVLSSVEPQLPAEVDTCPKQSGRGQVGLRADACKPRCAKFGLDGGHLASVASAAHVQSSTYGGEFHVAEAGGDQAQGVVQGVGVVAVGVASQDVVHGVIPFAPTAFHAANADPSWILLQYNRE